MFKFNTLEIAGFFVSSLALVITFWYVQGGAFQTQFTFLDTNAGGQQASVILASTASTTERVRDISSALDTRGDVTRLIIDDVKKGRGKEVRSGDTITVHFEGKTQDGKRFQSSYENNEPFTFTIGDGKTIEGWETGLLGMKVGGERVLVVPPHLAYGNRTVGVIPPNATLVFTIELLSIE